MNDKCCSNCSRNTFNCPVEGVKAGMWDDDKNSCNCHTPLPDKPGKIEPLVFHSHSDMVDKINEIIAVVNRREK